MLFKEGIGAKLAEGIKAMPEALGREPDVVEELRDRVLDIKGEGVVMHDHRQFWSVFFGELIAAHEHVLVVIRWHQLSRGHGQAQGRDAEHVRDELELLAVPGVQEWARPDETLRLDPEALAVHQRLQAHHNMWEANGDREHLAVAHELLEHLRAHAPPERRDAMVDDVKAYRDIVDSFASAG